MIQQMLKRFASARKFRLFNGSLKKMAVISIRCQ